MDAKENNLESSMRKVQWWIGEIWPPPNTTCLLVFSNLYIGSHNIDSIFLQLFSMSNCYCGSIFITKYLEEYLSSL